MNYEVKKKILGLLIALGISIPTYASIAVSPTRVEINANKIRNNYVTAAVEVRGETSRPVRFKAYPGYFTISDEGQMILEESKGDIHDISKKVRFVPSEFTVPPGKTQKLRINVAGIANLPEGESRAILFLEDIQPKELNLDTPTGIGAQLVLKTRVGIPIYVDKGKFIKKAEIEYLKDTLSKNNKVSIKQDELNTYSHPIYELQTIEDEVEYIANSICNLIKQGISISKIYLTKICAFSS